MPNILLPQQIFKVAEIESKFPTGHSKSRKVFFQCELRNVDATTGDITFGVIAYAAWRLKNNQRIPWEIAHDPVVGSNHPSGKFVSYPYNNNTPPYVAFGNSEIKWPLGNELKTKSVKGEDSSEIVKEGFYMELSKILDDKDLLSKSGLNCKAYISDNPHVSYTIELDNGSSDNANPCPPNRPAEP